MPKGSRSRLPCLVLALVAIGSIPARANIVVLGSFGSHGDLGFADSPLGLSVSFGATGQGSLFQLDGFLSAQNADFGSGVGVGQQLTDGPPSSMSFGFSVSQPTNHQLLLDYQFVNNSGSIIRGFQFSSFADGDIGPNFADESATVTGGLGNGRSGSGATSFQVGDPSLSSIFTNLLAATLSNTNDQTLASPGDVSSALGFSMASVGLGQKLDFKVLLSDDGSSLGGITITQTDPFYTTDRLTMSGAMTFSVVPEPSSIFGLSVGGCLALAIARFRRQRIG